MDLLYFGSFSSSIIFAVGFDEVEISGGVRHGDVQGDEEGLLMRTGSFDSSMMYRDVQQHPQHRFFFSTTGSGDYHPDSSSWATTSTNAAAAHVSEHAFSDYWRRK